MHKIFVNSYIYNEGPYDIIFHVKTRKSILLQTHQYLFKLCHFKKSVAEDNLIQAAAKGLRTCSKAVHFDQMTTFHLFIFNSKCSGTHNITAIVSSQLEEKNSQLNDARIISMVSDYSNGKIS